MNEEKTISIDRELLEEIVGYIDYTRSICGEDMDADNLEGRVNKLLGRSDED